MCHTLLSKLHWFIINVDVGIKWMIRRFHVRSTAEIMAHVFDARNKVFVIQIVVIQLMNRNENFKSRCIVAYDFCCGIWFFFSAVAYDFFFCWALGQIWWALTFSDNSFWQLATLAFKHLSASWCEYGNRHDKRNGQWSTIFFYLEILVLELLLRKCSFIQIFWVLKCDWKFWCWSYF